MASRCPGCQQAFLPPKIYCERCFEETTDWVPVEGSGYVRTFSVLHVSLDEERLEPPLVVALVAWEGIRGGLVHRIGGVEPGSVKLSMAVEPVWAEERSGTLDDILYFRPAAVE